MKMVGDKGSLSLTARVRVRLETEVVDQLKPYRDALNYSIEYIVKHSTKNCRKHRVASLSTVHRNLYEKLKREFGLPSRIALDCHREVLALAKSYLGNGAKGNVPRVKTLRMWLVYGESYRVKDGYVEIIGGYRLNVIGWDKRCDNCGNKEARLVYKDGKIFIMIAKRVAKPNTIKPRGIEGIDINGARILYENRTEVKFIETVIDRAYGYVMLAQRLQEKYSSPRYQAWLMGRGVLSRIRSHFRKSGSMLADWARKTSLVIVGYSLKYELAIALEDLTNLMESLRKLPSNHRTRLIIVGYRRLQYRIKWPAGKHGVPLVVVEPKGTSTTCPMCESKMASSGYRMLKCSKRSFEEDMDIVVVLNTGKKALFKMGEALVLMTAPQMTYVNPNRCGEPMKRTKEPSPFWEGRRSNG